MGKVKFEPKDLVFGVLFIGLAIAYAVYGTRTLNFGTPARMGPGFFPLILSGVLGLFGLIVGIGAFRKEPTPTRVVPARAFILVILAPIVFGMTVRTLGFAIAIALITAISGFASRHMTVKLAIMIAVGFSVFCVVLFHYLLRMPIPVLGTVFEPLGINL